ncbi:hypothetical protein UY3_09159 [Chelonia mydas]|uniref:BHLH domain-containing protein n=1 Tax=Chelonia mydas TaxID=8469 RepID=M7BNM8_CHEMY|nr:hypothetical protein UY3_09159 [Chelonia mydas]
MPEMTENETPMKKQHRQINFRHFGTDKIVSTDISIGTSQTCSTKQALGTDITCGLDQTRGTEQALGTDTISRTDETLRTRQDFSTEKKNRETHNAVERHRKKKINAGINRIGELIPCSPALKQVFTQCPAI